MLDCKRYCQFEKDLEMPIYKNDMRKNATVDLHLKLTDILTTKKDIQIINQKNDVESLLILYL